MRCKGARNATVLRAIDPGRSRRLHRRAAIASRPGSFNYKLGVQISQQPNKQETSSKKKTASMQNKKSSTSLSHENASLRIDAVNNTPGEKFERVIEK
jgi:hypothetical protein